jgi:hypothetical protein
MHEIHMYHRFASLCTVAASSGEPRKCRDVPQNRRASGSRSITRRKPGRHQICGTRCITSEKQIDNLLGMVSKPALLSHNECISSDSAATSGQHDCNARQGLQGHGMRVVHISNAASANARRRNIRTAKVMMQCLLRKHMTLYERTCANMKRKFHQRHQHIRTRNMRWTLTSCRFDNASLAEVSVHLAEASQVSPRALTKEGKKLTEMQAAKARR